MDKRFFSRGAPAVFSESALVIVGAAVSLFLQVISFFTTLDGASDVCPRAASVCACGADGGVFP